MISPSPLGSFSFVLHSHLPYVLSHGQWPHGAVWLYEAAAETYLPLLNALHAIEHPRAKPLLTLGLTPVLCEMLRDHEFRFGFPNYLQERRAAARDLRHQSDELRVLSKYWEDYFARAAHDFHALYAADLLSAFQALQDAGKIEILGGAATHAYLPLLSTDESLNAQIALGAESYAAHFGRAPRGIWLPECAYRPAQDWRAGIETVLEKHGLQYFIADTHLVSGGRPIHISSTGIAHPIANDSLTEYSPEDPRHPSLNAYRVLSQNRASQVAVLARHQRTSMQVWSSDHGYPGEAAYLDFHKTHFPDGLKLWRVTAHGDGEKELYQPHAVAEKCLSHARHFVSLVRTALAEYSATSGEANGLVCAPYDTELFGHWWHEGPQWLELVLRELARDDEIILTSCSDYLETHPPHEALALPAGSWGNGGAHAVWQNQETEWVWKELHRCENAMREIAREYSESPEESVQTLAAQCARELLLMQSSDWTFLITVGTARDYAEHRLREHIAAFDAFCDWTRRAAQGEVFSEEEWENQQLIMGRDRLFPTLSTQPWRG